MSQSAELDPVFVNPLRRPEKPPRKRSLPSPGLPARRDVIRLAGLMVAGTVLCTFAGRITGFVLEPVVSTYRVGLEIRDMEQAVAREGATNEQLRQDVAYLRTARGVEQEARRRGWVRPGEIALSVVLPEAPAQPGNGEQPGTPSPTQAAAGGMVSDRIRAAVDTCLAVFGRPRPRE